MKIAILQPMYPHYRKSFFQGLSKKFDIDLFSYEKSSSIDTSEFSQSNIKEKKLSTFSITSKLNIYNFIPLLSNKYDIIIIPGEIRSISAWILLFLGKFISSKIILWGHGISVKNYLDEEKNLFKIRVFFHKLADQNWLYTKKEKNIWSKYIDETKLIALNNSINTEEILTLPKLDQEKTKKKYHIPTKFNLIYCARFTENRRIDLMIEIIQKMKDKDVGFIIIGEGKYKPDFSHYKNVYDFGSVYDDTLKHELFTIADLYLQPAWVGLSIVEAMAYGKPIITFERSVNILQCVEYSYIEHKVNGYIGKSVDDIVTFIENIESHDLIKLQEQTKKYAKLNFGIEKMIISAENAIRKVNNK